MKHGSKRQEFTKKIFAGEGDGKLDPAMAEWEDGMVARIVDITCGEVRAKQ